jgi:lipopolysaccharide heptosyltransferase II
LVIKLRAIGDVVMSTIVIENLHRAFPHAAIDYLTEAAAAEVVQGHPLLRRVLVLDRTVWEKKKWPARWLANLSFLQSVRHENYDLVLDFFGNPRSALITLWSAAPLRVGYDYRIRRWAYNRVVTSRANEMHEADWHLDALTALGIPVVSHALHVAFGRPDEEKARAFLHPLGWPTVPIVAINFSGGWPAKRWPLHRFAQLTEAIAERYPVRFIAVWGPGEKEGAERLAAASRASITPTPATSLKELAALLHKTSIMVTNDSGPMHIAAAVGTPCVAIFGPTNPRLQGPYGDRHVVVRNETLACLGCNRLACSHTSCMEKLPVSDVLAAFTACAAKNGLFA